MIQIESMYVIYNKRFQKKYSKISEKIKNAFKRRLRLLQEGRDFSQLAIHNLHGKWKGYKSMNVNGDWRAIYHELENGEIEWVEFVEIGTHSQLYK